MKSLIKWFVLTLILIVGIGIIVGITKAVVDGPEVTGRTIQESLRP